MIITLPISKEKIELSEESLTWGQKELIRFTMFDPMGGKITSQSMLDSRILRMKFAILAINDGEITFSDTWVMALKDQDGAFLIEEINKIDSKKNTTSESQKSSEENHPVK